MNLRFATENEALQYLADVTGKRIKVAEDKASSSEIKTFIEQYFETMLWAEKDDDGNPLDDNYDMSDISSELIQESTKDVKRFLNDNYEFIKVNMLDTKDIKRAAHDFWLTRNGHGAGFWDGDWDFELDGKNVGDYLTKESESYDTVDVYVGDDGKIYS